MELLLQRESAAPSSTQPMVVAIQFKLRDATRPRKYLDVSRHRPPSVRLIGRWYSRSLPQELTGASRCSSYLRLAVVRDFLKLRLRRAWPGGESVATRSGDFAPDCASRLRRRIVPHHAACTMRPGQSPMARIRISRVADELWHGGFPSRWKVVAGTPRVGRKPMTFYSPDHPMPNSEMKSCHRGLTSLDEAKRE